MYTGFAEIYDELMTDVDVYKRQVLSAAGWV